MRHIAQQRKLPRVLTSCGNNSLLLRLNSKVSRNYAVS
jgi:hypothetical protein